MSIGAANKRKGCSGIIFAPGQLGPMKQSLVMVMECHPEHTCSLVCFLFCFVWSFENVSSLCL